MSTVKKIRIKNFKSLEDVKIDLTQLNLLFGANSSGKSSFLKALMFLGKNFELDGSGKNVMYKITEDVDLNSFEETVYNHDLTRNIEFEITLSGKYFFPTLDSILQNIEACKEINILELIQEPEIFRWGNKIPISKKEIAFECDVKMSFDCNGINDIKYEFSEQNYVYVNCDELYKKNLSGFNSLSALTLLFILTKEFNYTSYTYGSISEEWDALNDTDKVKTIFPKLEFSYLTNYVLKRGLVNFFNLLHLGTTRKIPENAELVRDLDELKHNYYGLATFLLKSFVRRTSTLEENPETGKLHYRSQKGVAFLEWPAIGIPYASMSHGTLTPLGNIETEIYDNTYDYIRYELSNFGIDLCYSMSLENSVFRFELIDKNKKSIGFKNASSGLTQLFPIIVCSAILRKQINFESQVSSHVFRQQEFETLLLEQPELHLHPKLQSQLAILFSEILKYLNDIHSLFIETHSEHLIRKLQVLIAKGELAREKVGVWYFRKVNGVTKVEKMEIDENGLFKKDWPDGFFDDSTDLTMELFEALRKRKN